MIRRSGGSRLEDILSGARVGVVFGAAYCFWAVIVLLIGGQEAFEAKDTSFAAMIAAYLAGGAIAGGTVGLLRRWRGTGLGKVGVGLVAALPVALGMRLAVRGLVAWERIDSLTVLIVTVIWGVGGAVVFWRD